MRSTTNFASAVIAALFVTACGSSEDAPLTGVVTPVIVDEERGDIALSMQAESMTADETNLYVFTTWKIVRVSKANGVADTIANGELVNSTSGIAVDDKFVYWSRKAPRAGEGSIRRMPKIGGAIEEYVTKRTDPNGIAIDAENVYWTEDNRRDHVKGKRDGRIVAMPKSSGGAGEPIVLADDVLPERIIVAGDYVYWSTAPDTIPNAKIRRVAKTGGEPETLVDVRLRGPRILGLAGGRHRVDADERRRWRRLLEARERLDRRDRDR
jgi:hypothetical protein